MVFEGREQPLHGTNGGNSRQDPGQAASNGEITIGIEENIHEHARDLWAHPPESVTRRLHGRVPRQQVDEQRSKRPIFRTQFSGDLDGALRIAGAKVRRRTDECIVGRYRRWRRRGRLHPRRRSRTLRDHGLHHQRTCRRVLHKSRIQFNGAFDQALFQRRYVAASQAHSQQKRNRRAGTDAQEDSTVLTRSQEQKQAHDACSDCISHPVQADVDDGLHRAFLRGGHRGEEELVGRAE